MGSDGPKKKEMLDIKGFLFPGEGDMMNACELGGCTSGILLPEFGATPKLADLPVAIHTVTYLCWLHTIVGGCLGNARPLLGYPS